MSEATPTGVRPFLNDRPDSRTRSLPDSMARDPKYLGKKKKKKKKKYPTITRGDVTSYCPSDVDDTNTQHMIRYKHAGI